MLLTLSTTHRPATDLGYLLHKNPARPQSKPLAFGVAHVFYPEAGEGRCEAALMLEVDPVALVRGRGGRGGRGAQALPSFALSQYVNDRPYAAGSFLSVALAQVYGSALAGRCRERPGLAGAAIPLTATVHGLPCRGGEAFLRGLFEPLGYAVTADRLPLDPRFPEWGEGRYFDVTLAATVRLAELLAHLYVLVPVLDDQKHYYVGGDEVDKLLRRGESWLAGHPLREEVARRYLKRRGSLVRRAMETLTADDPPAGEDDEGIEEAEAGPTPRVHDARLDAVAAVLKEKGCRAVADLGCGEGRLLRRLLGEPQFERVVGLDVSSRALEVAEDRLKPDRMPEARRRRLTLAQGALTYRDRRLERGGELAGPAGLDGAALAEVIEHLDPPRLPAMTRALFAHARPRVVVVTTPNRDYNPLLAGLPAGGLRHRDHRFEFSRGEFAAWCDAACAAHGYAVTISPLGPADDAAGGLSQMAVFERKDGAS